MIRTHLLAVTLLGLARCAAADSPPKRLANSSGSLLAMETRTNAEVTAPKGALTQITYEQLNQPDSKPYDAVEQAPWTEVAPAYDSTSGTTERWFAQFDSFSPSPFSQNNVDGADFLAEEVAPVPEPTTWLVGAFAFAGVVLSQRRRFTGQPNRR